MHQVTSLHCPHCLVIMRDMGSLKAHIVEAHNSLLPYTCSLCGKGYLSSGGLYLHKHVHEGKSYTCPVCDWKFAQKSSVKRHMARSHQCCQCAGCLAVLPLGVEYDQHMLYCNNKAVSF
uniref:C2H2-type domain-containing protein n=1 Tax=Arion vulgaris TaxID=1028688 RepID=A0A0B6YY08_9EUPU